MKKNAKKKTATPTPKWQSGKSKTTYSPTKNPTSTNSSAWQPFAGEPPSPNAPRPPMHHSPSHGMHAPRLIGLIFAFAFLSAIFVLYAFPTLGQQTDYASKSASTIEEPSTDYCSICLNLGKSCGSTPCADLSNQCGQCQKDQGCCLAKLRAYGYES